MLLLMSFDQKRHEYLFVIIYFAFIIFIAGWIQIQMDFVSFCLISHSEKNKLHVAKFSSFPFALILLTIFHLTPPEMYTGFFF